MTQTAYHSSGTWHTAYRIWHCACGARVRQRRGESQAAWRGRCTAHAVLMHNTAELDGPTCVWHAGEDVG